MNATDERGAYRGPEGRAVQQMFGAIAHRYDLLNHLLSLSIDRYWRWRAVRLMQSLGTPSDALGLDLCCGTGDLALAAARRLGIPMIGCDFSHPMLARSSAKVAQAGMPSRVRLAEADALRLPFRDDQFTLATVAFGVRNLAELETGLAEMYRVLRPGGALVILEFSRPVLPLFRASFDFYFTRILPRLGSWISGTEGPYQYLPSSVRRFPAQREFARRIEAAGFIDVAYRNLSGGIAALHWGTKPRGTAEKT